MYAGQNPCFSTSAIAGLANGRAAVDLSRSFGCLVTSLTSLPMNRDIMPLKPTAADNSSEVSARSVVRTCYCYRIFQTSSLLSPRVWMTRRNSNHSRQFGPRVLSLGICWIPASSSSINSSLPKISNSSFIFEQRSHLLFYAHPIALAKLVAAGLASSRDRYACIDG